MGGHKRIHMEHIGTERGPFFSLTTSTVGGETSCGGQRTCR